MTTEVVGLRSPEQGATTTPAEPRTKSPEPPRTPRRTRKQFGVALLTLAYVAAIVLGTLLVGGIVLHALVPSRHIDMFAALHNLVVVGVLLGLVALWLLPPYPWAAPQPSTEPQEPAQPAGETEGGDTNVTDLSQSVSGRFPSHRPMGAGGGGLAGSLLNSTAQQHQQ